MKRYIKLCVTFVMIFSIAILLSACKPKIEKGYIKTGTLATTIVKGEELVVDNVIAIYTYSDGSVIEVGSENLSFSNFESNGIGNNVLTITYEDYSFDVSIKVVATEADVGSITSLSSGLIEDYNERRGNQENDYEQFIYQNEPIYVGDDNVFDFRIFATGIDGNGMLQTDINKVRTNIVVKLKTDNGSQILDEEAMGAYVNIDTENTTLDFTEEAVGKEFDVEVSAVNVNELYLGSQTSFSARLKVVDGYNVYNANDLSVYDNYSHAYDNIRPTNERVNAIVLQNDIFITKDDVRQDVFWTSTHPNYNTVKDYTDQELVGTPIDYSSTGVYHRQLQAGEDFNVYGNYFKIDVSKFPKMVVESDDGGSGKHGVKKENSNEDYITSHFSLFYNENISPVTINNKETLEPSNLNYSNIYFYGNGALNNQPENSGALIAYKVYKTNFTARNNITHNFYIANFFSQDEEFGEKEGFNYLDSCKAYNSYQTLVYAWGCKNLKMINCEYKYAGGPAIIADHVDADEDNGGYPSYIDCINCKISSIVSGREPWFVSYGATDLIMQLKTADQLFTGLVPSSGDEKMTSNGLPQNGKSIITQNLVDGVNVDCVNLMFAMKSGSAQGLTAEKINGYVRMFESIDDYNSYYGINGADKIKTTYGLDFTNKEENSLPNKSYMKGLVVENGVPVSGVLYFESNKGGGYINSNVAENNDASFVLPVTLYSITQSILNGNLSLVSSFRLKPLAEMKEILLADLLSIKNNGAISVAYDNALAQGLLRDGDSENNDDQKYSSLCELVNNFVMHTDGEYINIYLFNGMGAMVQIKSVY